jgi:alkylation response protein AidB-like acyl-CoA dehydrogenase
MAFANTEPGAGSDAANLRVTAAADGDGYVVDGAKAYITNGDIADHIVFTAVTHPDEEKKHRRVSMFVVDGNAPGLKRTRMKKQAWKISHLSSLIFDGVRVPKENMVGEPGRGFYQTMHVFNAGRIGVAALSFGAALGAYKAAYDYAGKRTVFGEKLIDHGSKRHEFAENITALEAGWLLIEKAAWLKDSGEEFRFNSSMAKLFATEEAMRVTLWAAETFGARGVLASGDVTRYPDDARGALVGEGAPEVQKKIVAEGIGHLLEGLL